MTDLSPAARAVWEAAVNTPAHMSYEYDIAAALRAAALHIDDASDGLECQDILRQIATELDVLAE